MRVGGQTLARVATLIDSHQLSSSFDRAFSIGNNMVSSAIWEKHARVSFSKMYKIARVHRTSAQFVRF